MENNRFDIREQKISDTEREFEKALRPLAFDDFNGQEKIIENLRVFVGGGFQNNVGAGTRQAR